MTAKLRQMEQHFGWIGGVKHQNIQRILVQVCWPKIVQNIGGLSLTICDLLCSYCGYHTLLYIDGDDGKKTVLKKTQRCSFYSSSKIHQNECSL